MKRLLDSLVPLAAIVVWSAAPDRADAYVTMVDNGPSSNRVDMVFLGDGYTESQIETVYPDHIRNSLDRFFDADEDPFPRYRNFFNVHRVNVISNESGADRLPDGIERDTALDASYYYDGGSREVLYVNSFKADDAIAADGLASAGITADMKMVTVNDTVYGGGGGGTAGSYAVYAGGNNSACRIALHELGHSFSRLFDEYTTANLTYTGGEPTAVNLTKSPNGEKWSRWLGYVDPDHPEMGPIGAYEGAAVYFGKGLYRPSLNSKMRSLDRPFDAVGREKIILDIYDYVDPLDGALNAELVLVDPDSLWVDVVDPDVIRVEWYVDGTRVVDASGETFRPLDLEPGEYVITARAYDDTPWVRTDRDKLEQTVDWSVVITSPDQPADFNDDGRVDIADVNLLTAEGDLSAGLPVGVADARFDLTGNGTIDTADLDQWLADAAMLNGLELSYSRGDANLDGDVDIWAFDGSGDAQTLSSSLGMATGAVWGDGDFNGDGDVDVWAFDGTGDAQLLSSNLGVSIHNVGTDLAFTATYYESAAFAVKVPEPGSLMMLATAGLFGIFWKRRRA